MRIDPNSKLVYCLSASREDAENNEPHQIQNARQGASTVGSAGWIGGAFIQRCRSAFRAYRFLLLLDGRANEAARLCEIIEETRTGRATGTNSTGL